MTLSSTGDRVLQAKESHVALGSASLFVREIGEGHPILVLHGGPDFDHSYLLPEMDRLAESRRLLYYDQRGRGRSAAGVRAEHVSLESEIADIEALRRHFELESFAVLGHSFGGLLAMEYATRHPARVSHLILMNTAPASHAQVIAFRDDRHEKTPDELERMKAIAASDAFRAGDVAAEAKYYHLHFHPALHDPAAHLDRVVKSLRTHFTPETILLARAIEERLYQQTWDRPDYDLTPKLWRLDVPALVLHGEHDFMPPEIAARIAGSIPGVRFVVLRDCGHFAYLEQPAETQREIAQLLRGSR
jgi:proline iminopeptidase